MTDLPLTTLDSHSRDLIVGAFTNLCDAVEELVHQVEDLQRRVGELETAV